MKKIQSGFDKVKDKLSENRLKLAAMWSYGNQIANMLLSQLSQSAQGTENQAQMQKIVAGLSLAQSEFAVMQTFLQASAAISSGNIVGGTLMYQIALMMQSSLFTAQLNKANADRAALASQQIRRQMEAYRS